MVSVLGSKLAPSTGIRLAGDGRVQIALSETALAGSMIEAAEQSEAVLTGRLLELGMTALVTVQPQPTGARLLVQIARTDDPQRVVAVASKPGETTFRLIDVSMAPEAALTSTLPAGTEILFGREIDGKLPHLVEKRAIMTGRDLVDAQPRREARTGEPIVTFRFSPAGARKFAQVTGENIGRPMAIVVDNEVLSAPVIREPITGGSGQISGNLTPEAANELAAVLRYGELPARLKVVGQTAKESAR